MSGFTGTCPEAPDGYDPDIFRVDIDYAETNAYHRDFIEVFSSYGRDQIRVPAEYLDTLIATLEEARAALAAPTTADGRRVASATRLEDH